MNKLQNVWHKVTLLITHVRDVWQEAHKLRDQVLHDHRNMGWE